MTFCVVHPFPQVDALQAAKLTCVNFDVGNFGRVLSTLVTCSWIALRGAMGRVPKQTSLP